CVYTPYSQYVPLTFRMRPPLRYFPVHQAVGAAVYPKYSWRRTDRAPKDVGPSSCGKAAAVHGGLPEPRQNMAQRALCKIAVELRAPPTPPSSAGLRLFG